VFVESESKKIGTLQVPLALLDAMRAATCVRVDTPQALRVALLKEEYTHFLADPDALGDKLRHLAPLHGNKIIAQWDAAARAGDHDALVNDLLTRHYDPTYARSITRNFPRVESAVSVVPAAIDAAAFGVIARQLIHSLDVAQPETVA
jgi:tRNA 2-selenouridine synthase